MGSREQIKERKFRNMRAYPAPLIPNPAHLDAEGNPVENEPAEIPDPTARYDMDEIFALMNCVTANLRELADDIGTFDTRIANAIYSVFIIICYSFMVHSFHKAVCFVWNCSSMCYSCFL